MQRNHNDLLSFIAIAIFSLVAYALGILSGLLLTASDLKVVPCDTTEAYVVSTKQCVDSSRLEP